ncbi:MAG: arginase family protein [Candidatus Tectomicrobia bacterium]|nr:arginase family protein [Candidatus Tectomicrobia bacterium]
MTRPEYRKAMDPIHPSTLPCVYADVPTFLAVPLARSPADLQGADAAVVGAPYQGPPGPGRVYRDSRLSPLRLRQDSIKYGGYLPELDLDVFEHLRLVDYGDAPIPLSADGEAAAALTARKVGEVLDAGVVAIVLGGTEAAASLGAVRAFAQRSDAVGLLTLDAHGDNLEDDADASGKGASWLSLALCLPVSEPIRHAHLGLRGPRNVPGQVEWFRRRGTRVFLAQEVLARGLGPCLREILEDTLSQARDSLLSVDLDVLDIGCAPGLDEPMGIAVSDLLGVCREAGRAGFRAYVIGWVPSPEPALHWIATWSVLFFLAGIAERRGAKDKGA